MCLAYLTFYPQVEWLSQLCNYIPSGKVTRKEVKNAEFVTEFGKPGNCSASSPTSSPTSTSTSLTSSPTSTSTSPKNISGNSRSRSPTSFTSGISSSFHTNTELLQKVSVMLIVFVACL